MEPNTWRKRLIKCVAVSFRNTRAAHYNNLGFDQPYSRETSRYEGTIEYSHGSGAARTQLIW